jgi:hypothetical protein
MLDSLEGVCPSQVEFEYPATSVLFSKDWVMATSLEDVWRMYEGTTTVTSGP